MVGRSVAGTRMVEIVVVGMGVVVEKGGLLGQ